VTRATRRDRITCRVRKRDRALLALGCVAWLWSCRDSASSGGPQPRMEPLQHAASERAASSATPPKAQRRSAVLLGTARAAFELVATSEGAVLFWAAPAACERGLSLQRLDAEGRAQGAAASIGSACASRSGTVSEVSAAAGGGQLGVAWIVEAAGQARVFATHGADAATAFAAPLQLGAAEVAARTERARLWLVAAESGQQRVAWHAPRAACTGEPGSCAQLVSEANPPAHDAAGRRGDVREIPQPCARLLVGSVWTQGVWYDAFCALDATGQHATTQVYAIRPEIFYAEASPALLDCEPLGMSPSRAGAVTWGRCADGLRAQAFAPDGRKQLVYAAQQTARCQGGRPVLAVRGQSGQLDALVLDAPRDRLELWLPPELAKPGSRAVFTGRRLLVAWPEGDHLVVASLRCQGQALVSEPPAML
jgi:hypothetical protein